jgi:site-specific recombinase XerD
LLTTAVHLLLNYLRQAGIIAPPSVESLPLTDAQQWLTRYEEHLGKVQGLAPTTRQRYLPFASRLLNIVSQGGLIEWSSINSDKVIEFVQADASRRKGVGAHATSTAIRSFLRFLVSEGQLSAGLETAIPNIPRWSQAALPQRLSEAEIDRLLKICTYRTAIGRRNHAILMLLSRLGLRAKEIAGMQLDDLDWINGSLLIHSTKTRSERILPMAQEVGDSLVSYLRYGRPATPHRRIFLDHTAPFRPLQTASAIKRKPVSNVSHRVHICSGTLPHRRWLIVAPVSRKSLMSSGAKACKPPVSTPNSIWRRYQGLLCHGLEVHNDGSLSAHQVRCLSCAPRSPGHPHTRQSQAPAGFRGLSGNTRGWETDSRSAGS